MLCMIGAKVIENIKIAPDIYKIRLFVPKISNYLLPGQFLHLRINQGVDPLLRRPFSVHRIVKLEDNRLAVEILYKVVGKGTFLLSEKCSGQTLDVLGPLGNGFDYSPSAIRYALPILVAGGMGIAPLLFLVEKILKDRAPKVKGKVIVFLGAATKKEILYAKELKKIGCIVKIATDDGTLGFKGYVSTLVEDFLARSKTLVSKPYLYACGPVPMLKRLSMLSLKYKLEGQVSVDEMMGCGIGACLGCVIKVKVPSGTTYRRICKDGPVFNIHELY